MNFTSLSPDVIHDFMLPFTRSTGIWQDNLKKKIKSRQQLTLPREKKTVTCILHAAPDFWILEMIIYGLSSNIVIEDEMIYKQGASEETFTSL